MPTTRRATCPRVVPCTAMLNGATAWVDARMAGLPDAVRPTEQSST